VTIEKAQACAMKNLDVSCEQGDKIKLDVIRTHDQRGVVFLNINSSDAIGDHIMLYINDNKPEILKIEQFRAHTNAQSKGTFLPLNLISKLKSATSVRFKISMKSRKPIDGSLGHSHFEWLKRFGNACS
jgi:hypothetical protein